MRYWEQLADATDSTSVISCLLFIDGTNKVTYEDPYVTFLDWKHRGRMSKRRFRNVIKMAVRRRQREQLLREEVRRARRPSYASPFDVPPFDVKTIFDR